jgi:molybdopterin-synthase adenylyltransferase
MLTPDELSRYQRQIGPGVLSLEGQQRLKGATALVTRAGGMGGPAALGMVMAGVGRLIIAHSGDMIPADLNRQLLGDESVVGRPRARHFAERLRSMNRFVQIEALDREPDDDEALELARRCDIVLACPPSFEERLRLNRAAVAAGKPLVDAAQWGMTGTLVVVEPGKTACLECLYPEPPEFEELFPVLGAISAALGALAALEAIKVLSGCGTPLFGRMLVYDGYRGASSVVELARDPRCGCCGAAIER